MEYIFWIWEFLVQNTWLLITIFASAILASLTLYSGQITSNFIGGIMLSTRSIYKTGDYVTIGEAHGRVRRVGWLYTQLEDTVNRNVHIIENSAVTGVIINHSKIGGSPVYVEIPIYDYNGITRIAFGEFLVDTVTAWDENHEEAKINAWIDSHDGEAEIWKVITHIPDDKLSESDIMAGELKVILCEELEAHGFVIRDDDRVDVFMGKEDA